MFKNGWTVEDIAHYMRSYGCSESQAINGLDAEERALLQEIADEQGWEA